MDDHRIDRVQKHWGRALPQELAQQYAMFPMSHPAIVAAMNRRASGSADMDAYVHFKRFLGERGIVLPFEKAVSVGCGRGTIEMGLAQAGFFHHCTGFDLAEDALVLARAEAVERGLAHRLDFLCLDLENDRFDTDGVDLVIGHQSIHHVSNLEALFEQLDQIMRPGAILHLHEYIGPNRFQWTDLQLEEANRWLKYIPSEYKITLSGEQVQEIQRPTIERMIEIDPSEAVRSQDIVATTRARFDLIERIDLGGTLTMPALAGIAQNFDYTNETDMFWLEKLIKQEDILIKNNILQSNFAILTFQKING